MTAQRTALITGAAGFVGRRLARALRATGWHVTGIDRASIDRMSVDGGQAFDDVMPCDVRDGAALARVAELRSYDAIVHLAAVLPSSAAAGELVAVNANGTSALLARVANPGTHVVLFSTGLVYGPQAGPFRESMPCLPSEPYAQSKLEAESIVNEWSRATRSPVAVLRPSVLYGPHAPSGMLLASLLATLRRGEPFAMTAGEQLRDFVHVDDAVSAVLHVLERRAHGTWNLASGESISVLDAAVLAARIAGRNDLLRIGALPYRDNEVFDYRLDISKLRASLAWQPRIELATGLRGLWEATA
jgi:nucleoside-diphosphate-sugar epimerase